MFTTCDSQTGQLRLAVPVSLGVLFLLSLFLAGCAAGGAPYADRPVPAGKALIYIYREGSMLGGANTWDLYANGKGVAKVANGGYCDYTADPGKIEFTQLLEMRGVDFLGAAIIRNAGPQPIAEIRAEPDTTYYFKFEIGPKMNLVSKEEAVKAMKGMHRFDNPDPLAK